MFTPTLSSETSPLPGNKSAAMNVVCSLCTLDMVNPMITRCGHLYCFDCIDGLIEKNKGSSKALCNFESCGKPLIRHPRNPYSRNFFKVSFNLVPAAQVNLEYLEYRKRTSVELKQLHRTVERLQSEKLNLSTQVEKLITRCRRVAERSSQPTTTHPARGNATSEHSVGALSGPAQIYAPSRVQRAASEAAGAPFLVPAAGQINRSSSDGSRGYLAGMPVDFSRLPMGTRDAPYIPHAPPAVHGACGNNMPFPMPAAGPEPITRSTSDYTHSRIMNPLQGMGGPLGFPQLAQTVARDTLGTAPPYENVAELSPRGNGLWPVIHEPGSDGALPMAFQTGYGGLRAGGAPGLPETRFDLNSAWVNPPWIAPEPTTSDRYAGGYEGR